MNSTVRHYGKIFAAATASLMLSASLMLASCGGTQGASTSNSASASASSSSSASAAPINENTGRDTMPDDYTPGSVADGTYINDTVHVKFPVPDGFEVLQNDKPNKELNLADATGTKKVVIAYATDGVLDDFVTAYYEHQKQQESPQYDYHADLTELEIAGENRQVITSEMTTDGVTSATAAVFFEGDGHIVAVTATTDDITSAIELISLAEQA